MVTRSTLDGRLTSCLGVTQHSSSYLLMVLYTLSPSFTITLTLSAEPILNFQSALWRDAGVAPGFWDMFVLAPLEQLFRPTFRKEDFTLGKKLGEGAFGTVYKATLNNKKLLKRDGPLVIKKANEFGAVEIWMNERVRRACRKSCADFVQGFLETSGTKGKGEEFWLVWRYEGTATLADLMNNKDFPYNVEEAIMGAGKSNDIRKGPERESRILQTILRQILNSLAQLHSTGIVHRDIKPQNIILSEGAETLLDFSFPILNPCST